MTNSKSTKRALFTSALAMLMCVAMLIGTTFAWFTDTASTAVNKIQSGTLDVALEMNTGTTAEPNWVSAEGETLTFKTADGREADKILWEPGCTYELPELRVVNKGNLALKYKVIITGIQGNAKLNEAIEWTMKLDDSDYAVDTEHKLAAKTEAATDSDIFTISGHMQETAGNEYQNLSIDGIAITVIATQLDSEYDSYNNIYDKEATYLNTDADGAYLIGSAGDLRYFAKTVNTYAANTSFKLTSDIDLGGVEWTPIAWTVNHGGTFDGQGHTISNFKVNGQKNLGLFSDATGVTIKNLNVDRSTVTGIGRVGAIVGQGLCTHLENCKVTNSTITASVYNNDGGDKAGAIVGQLSAQSSASMTNCHVENCTVKAYRDLGGIAGHVQYSGSTVTDNTVKNSTVINDLSSGLEVKNTVGEIVGRQDDGFTLNTTSNTATNVAITVIGENNRIEKTGDNANIVIADTAVINSTTSIGNSTTISGEGTDKTTVEVVKAKVATDDVTIKDMTIKATDKDANSSAITINSSANKTVIENVVLEGQGWNGDTKGIAASGNNLLIRNAKISSVFRGIIFWDGIGGENVIEDCVIDNVVYTFNVNASSVDEGTTITIKGSTLNGWTSYSSCISKVTFEDCNLGKSSSSGYEYLRPYCNTEITGCEFTSNAYQLNAAGSGTYTITLTNCTKNGTAITAENVQSLLLDTSSWNSNVTLIVDGTIVTIS